MTAEIENEEVDEKPRTLFVGNIPSTTKKRELEVLFGDIGPLKRCHMQYPRKGTSKQEESLVAYITYALCQDAVTAIEQFGGHKIGKSKLNIKLIKSRSDQHREPREPRAIRPIGVSNSSANFEPIVVKQPRAKPINKKPRLIVRNLSFNANEELIRNHFSSCGEIKEVSVLRKANGKLVGCAFIQYATVFEAAKAINTLNLQPFLDRPIAIDWAVPKDKFQSKEPQVKVESEEELEVKQEIKEEEDSDDDGSTKKTKKNKKIKTEDDDDDSDMDLDDDDDDEDDEEEEKYTPVRKQTNDADEGKTLFIRNLSFDTTEEELKSFFETFGPLRYALVCKDKLTEHPKGTAFVKYMDLEGAEKCLAKYEEDASEFVLSDRYFYVSVALSKGKLESKLNVGNEKPKKDGRNLFLAREGFIRPESEAAIGVSVQDMHTRSALHQKKKQLLKDLGVFVSETRLCVHNLPPNLKDDGLRRIFLKHGGEGTVVTEAKIMRDYKSLNRDSKEYGFVSFTTHEHALNALRTTNNNPSVFIRNRRPIVEFSLENRNAVVARERRLEKSKEMNLLVQAKKVEEKTAENNEEEGEVQLSKKMKRKLKKQRQKEAKMASNDTEVPVKEEDQEEEDDDEPSQKKRRHRDIESNLEEFSGLTAKEGVTALPSFKPKGKITRKSLKPPRNKGKGKQDRRMREPKTKKKDTGRDRTDNVDKLVSKHQREDKEANRIIPPKSGKKWFD